MANTLRIKRRAAGGSTGAPTTLANAELAYNESDAGNGILYYGVGTGGAGGSATSIVAIAGDGAYCTLTSAQTITGNKTFTGTVDLSGATLSGNTTFGNNLVVTGDLTVNGTTTTVNSTTVTVDDKNIELGTVASPSDTTADGGGLTLKGATDKTFNWVNSTDSWTASEHIDLASGKEFKIAGTSVLSSSTLGSGVTGSSLTSLGTVTTGVWNATDIAVGAGGTGASTASGARSNLGLAIGSDIQAYHADLATLSGMQTGAATALAALTSTEVAILDGATVTTAELNYVDGVTSNVQTQINGATSDITDLQTLTGIADGSSDLGTFSGSTISNNDSIKDALQALETAVESAGSASSLTAATTDISDLQTLTGIADGNSDLGTFSGSTVSDNTDIKSALQELETAVEGNVGGSTTVQVVSSATNSNHYITFVDSNNSSGTQESVFTDAGVYYNPYLNQFNANGVNTGVLSLNSVDVTSTAAELNILDGVTASTSEINLLDGVTASTAELNILNGVTATAAELNILDGVTATAAELNILDGVTATAAELNILDGVTSTATELNLLDGVTATTAELNILDGVTATAAELNTLDGVTASATELNILDGVTSTTAELNLLDGVLATTAELNIVDGSTSATSTTLAAADRMVINDGGTMVQVALSDLVTFLENGTASGFELDGGTF